MSALKLRKMCTRTWLMAALCGVMGTATAGPGTLAAAARTILGPRQGVYVEAASGSVLLAQAADIAVHPASVSKVPTTLALLRKLGPEHRFVTTFSAAGPIADGSIAGDLVVFNDGNPSLVDEDALLVAGLLNQRGVRRVAGRVQARGPMIFDWRPDNTGEGLEHALSGQTSAAAWDAVHALALQASSGVSGARPTVQFEAAVHGSQQSGSLAPEAQQLLVVHRSQPLLPLIKALNDFSNNIFAPLAAVAGGAAAVESLARSVVPAEMRAEITLGDGAGADPTNRLSPRAAVKLLRALEIELGASGHRLVDILPVAGVDSGTLKERFTATPGCVVGKTGTFGSYGASALIGALLSADGSTVYFAILNHGVPVPTARKLQDRFVGVMLSEFRAKPWPYQPDPQPAIARALVEEVRPDPSSGRTSAR